MVFSNILLSALYVKIIALETVGNGAIHRRMTNNLCPQKKGGRHNNKCAEKNMQEKNEREMLNMG